jgi:C4-dicarboxylate-specific signal transduction histidine kinase
VDVNAALWDAFLELDASPEELRVTGVQEITPGQKSTVDSGVLAIGLDREENLPKVAGNVADMRRLIRFLLCNAARSVPSGGVHVWARTRRLAETGQVQVIVQDSGASVAADLLPSIFLPGHEPREGMDGLELAACRSIVRRLGGSIEAHSPPEGGLVVTAGFPASA